MRLIYLVITFILIVIPCYGNSKQTVLIHNKPQEVNCDKGITFKVNFLDMAMLDQILLYYKTNNQKHWSNKLLDPENGQFEATITCDATKDTLIQYYIEAYNLKGKIATTFASRNNPETLVPGLGSTEVKGGEPEDQNFNLYMQELQEINNLDEEVVGVSKKREKISRVPMQVYLIKKQELDRWGVRHLYETLQRVPGFSFYNIDYYGQYGIMSRGSYSIWRFGYSIELMKFPDFGHNIFAPKFFKSIEVARGPGGLTWGSAAEAGLFNFTLRDDLNGGEVSIEYGNYNRKVTDLLYGKQLGDGNHFFVGFHYEEQEAGEHKNSFGTDKIWYSNGLNPSFSTVAKIQYKPFKAIFYREHADHIAPRLWFGDDKDALTAGIIEKTGEKPHDQLITTLFRLEYQLPSYENSDEDAILSRFSTMIYGNFFRKQWWTEGVALDTQGKEEIGFNGELSLLNDMLTFNFGGEFWGKDIATDPSMTTAWAHDEHNIAWYDTALDESTINYSNFYIQSNLNIDRFSLVAGTRLDWEEDGAPDPWIIGAYRLGAIYQPVEPLTFKLLYNKTKRRPAFNERAGSPSAESLQSIDFVTIFTHKKIFQANIGIAYQTLTDTITRDATSTELNEFTNSGGSSTIAIEWNIQFKPLKSLLLYTNGSYNRAKAADNSILPHHKDDSLLFVPLFSTIFGGEFRIKEMVFINLNGRLIGSIPYLALDGSEKTSDPAFFLDATIHTKYFFKRFKASLSLLNMLNQQPDLPAFGEHAENQNGTLKPEGLRVMGRFTVLIP